MSAPDPLQQGRYTREQLFAHYFRRPTWWLHDHLDRYEGDAPQLIETLVQALPKQDSLPKRTYIGMSLMWLGRAEGAAEVRATLQGGDDTARLFVLDELRRHPRLQTDAQRRLAGTALGVDEIAADLAPLLADPDRVGAAFAREWCIAHAFAAARPALAALRGHAQWSIAREVLDAYRRHDIDEGTLGLLERWLTEPGIRTTQAERERLHGLCRMLAEWAGGSRQPFLPPALGRIALCVLQQAMDAHDRPVRLQPAARGWLEVEALLDVVAAQRPEGTPWLLKRMAALAQLHPLLRAHALVHYQAVSGKPHEHAAQILAALWALPHDERGDDRIVGRLAAGGLLDAAALGQGLRNPLWTGALLAQRPRWPALGEAATTTLLLQALDACASVVPLRQHAIEALLRALAVGAGAARREATGAALRRLAGSIGPADASIASLLAAWQLRLGDRDGVALAALPPWPAMRLHWQRCGYDWAAIAGRLAQAGLIDAPSPAGLAALAPVAGLAPDAADDQSGEPLLELFARGGRPLHEVHLVDNGYEHAHDRLFATLASMLRPPLAVTAVQQQGQMRFDLINRTLPPWTSRTTLRAPPCAAFRCSAPTPASWRSVSNSTTSSSNSGCIRGAPGWTTAACRMRSMRCSPRAATPSGCTACITGLRGATRARSTCAHQPTVSLPSQRPCACRCAHPSGTHRRLRGCC
jgi:hypothetical protein